MLNPVRLPECKGVRTGGIWHEVRLLGLSTRCNHLGSHVNGAALVGCGVATKSVCFVEHATNCKTDRGAQAIHVVDVGEEIPADAPCERNLAGTFDLP